MVLELEEKNVLLYSQEKIWLKRESSILDGVSSLVRWLVRHSDIQWVVFLSILDVFDILDHGRIESRFSPRNRGRHEQI